MKSLLISLMLLAAAASVVAAQTPNTQTPNARTPAAANDLYRMGDLQVSIPPPEGFVEAASRLELLKKLFEATEAPALDLLAVHLPADVMGQLARGEKHDLEFYTKVSVSKSLRGVDTSRESFAQLVAYLRANTAKVFDINSPELQSQFKHQNEGLSKLLQKDSRLDLTQPVSLGEIVSTPDSFGVLLLTKVKIQSGDFQKEALLLAGTSAVRVKNRLVWIYTYRKFDSEKDADVIRDFTRRWLADILRANALQPRR